MSQIWDIVWRAALPSGMGGSTPMDSWNSAASRSVSAPSHCRRRSGGAARREVVIADDAWAEVRKSREIIEALADDQEPHYGVSTGFGALATRHIPVELRGQLQRSLVRSHAAGSGPEVEREVVRALMLLRISTLATGRTGIREETLRTYVAMLNAGLTPVVYEYGSLGCSGDLAPLAHCALALMGEGIVRDAPGALMPTARRVRRRRHHPRHACREGRPGLDQRH